MTGGPGSGKSTVLDAAARAGYLTVPESGRSILQRQALIGGNATHTGDALVYAELMLDRDIANYLDYAGSERPVLFDRGIGDLLGYRSLTGKPLAEHFDRAATRFRYNRLVFAAPPWKDIYGADTERKQDWDEAVRTYDAMHSAYEELGYEVLVLPKADVETRLAFLVERVGPA